MSKLLADGTGMIMELETSQWKIRVPGEVLKWMESGAVGKLTSNKGALLERWTKEMADWLTWHKLNKEANDARI